MFIKCNKKLNKRGFTLIELTMVMAISAIIATMIVSFCTLISAQTKKNELRADFMQDVIDLRTDLQVAFAEIDNGGEITTDDNIPKIGDNKLSFDKESYAYIDEITFTAQGKILKVTVSNSTLSEPQSFILISKVE
ncbi:MAG: type II secretion system protein [Clostridia bacterium]|nr:type II secretion system protein [Clostridia bacterium]